MRRDTQSSVMRIQAYKGWANGNHPHLGDIYECLRTGENVAKPYSECGVGGALPRFAFGAGGESNTPFTPQHDRQEIVRYELNIINELYE